MSKKAPHWLSHKPVITVDYEEHDSNAGDAKFLSLGHSTWNAHDFSAKIFRKVYSTGTWSRQGEEMPLWRVLDLATLIVATITGKQSNLSEFVQDHGSEAELKDFLDENMETLAPKMNELREMLKQAPTGMSTSGAPNIFSFATSELSQDAMLAWLMQWADPKYKDFDLELHTLAQNFVRMLLGKDSSFEIKSIEVGRQWENIDIWAEINEDAFLVIEDKTGTSIHDNQLEKYTKSAQDYYKGKRDNLFFAYVKTENEPKSMLKKIESQGYRTIDRTAILSCLNTYLGNHPLLTSYRQHLQEIEDATSSFKRLPAAEWKWHAWQGFYKELDERLSIDSWAYVPNPSGGFLGAWWYFTNIDCGNLYLQFEQGKLCFKISCDNVEERSKMRWHYHNRLMKVIGNDFPEIKRPDRFGTGEYMTIAVVNRDDIFGTGIVDMDALINKLQEYQGLIDTMTI